ncbi:MAG: efflux RND transporter periplasmic adaptor subunit [Thermodesulfobacteriota bacterium]|nr:efflux RND transporter periplasmic adaptor subunit [Thermodesulfobacteriota bacterium]
MKGVTKVLIWLVVIAGILYAGYRSAGVLRERKEATRVKGMETGQTLSPAKVFVAAVQKGTITEGVWVTGEVRALAAVDVTAKVSGRLERLRLPDGTLIEEGVEVRKGELIAVIEHEQYRAAVQSAEAALALAEASKVRSEVNLVDARREKERWIKLRKSGVGTQQAFDLAMTAFERARSEVQMAEAQILQAQAALEQAKVNLADAKIKAPLSGIVSRKYVDEGSFVGPSVPLFKLSDIDQVEITGGVADKHYPNLTKGRTSAEIEVDAYPGESFTGTVSRVRPELDRVTRTVLVTIRAPNDQRRLKPGMYARIRLVLRERIDVLLVPDEALLASDDGLRVFVVNDEMVHLRPVRIGLEEGNLNEVLEGLREGERVILKGKQMMRDGMKVTTEEVTKP